MIRIECDKCEKTIDLDDATAGTKVTCPFCGDMNRVPEATVPAGISARASGEAKADKADKAAAAGYPPDHGPEAAVVKVRRCWFRTRPLRFLFAVAVMSAGITGVIWLNTRTAPVERWWYALFGPAVVIPAIVLLWWWVDRFSAAIIITTKRTTMQTGIFNRSTSEVVHDNIRNVQVDQTFWQRVWKVGKLGISSSGQDGVEIQINHLPNPNRLREIVDLYRPL
jgi:phage FluMu protein Com